MKIKLVGIHPRQEESSRSVFKKIRDISYPIELTLITENDHYFVNLNETIGVQDVWSVCWFKTDNVMINEYVKNYYENPPFPNTEYDY